MWEGYFDGACDNNGTKEMQIGAVLIHDGSEVEKISVRAGKGTSNVAEYLALIALLEALERQPALDSDVWIYGDSLLVIKQVTGRWRVKTEHLLQYRERARELNRRVCAHLHWIPREQNAVADELSKRGFVERAPHTVRAYTPLDLAMDKDRT